MSFLGERCVLFLLKAIFSFFLKNKKLLNFFCLPPYVLSPIVSLHLTYFSLISSAVVFRSTSSLARASLQVWKELGAMAALAESVKGMGSRDWSF